jgi:hypothetical protein
MPADDPPTATDRLTVLIGALRDVGVQPGDQFTAQDWQRIEVTAFGPLNPVNLRGYRDTLKALGVIEQLGGGRGGVPLKGMKILALPEGPLELGLA